MPSYFTEGFCVREPSWHRQETLIMDDLVLPRDRELAIGYAGHDFKVIETWNGNVGKELVGMPPDGNTVRIDGKWYTFDLRAEKKGLYINQMRDNGPGPVHGNFLEVVNDSFGVIQNDVGWDILEAVAGEGVKLETGLTLKDGALCVVTFYLDEPVQIPGDDSPIFPYGAARWAHDGTGALNVRSFITRIVCANTDAIAEGEAKRAGTDFTFKHTKNWQARVEDAKMAIKGMRVHMDEYVEMVDELVKMTVTPDQRELFITQGLLPMPPEALISDRVKNNVENERWKVRNIFNTPTIPERHQFTGYGLRLAGVEYLDHLRGYRNSDTYVGRQLLKTEPAKAKLTELIREVVTHA